MSGKNKAVPGMHACMIHETFLYKHRKYTTDDNAPSNMQHTMEKILCYKGQDGWVRTENKASCLLCQMGNFTVRYPRWLQFRQQAQPQYLSPGKQGYLLVFR